MFSDKITDLAKLRSPIALGIDPNFALLPLFLQPKDKNDISAKLTHFSNIVLEEVNTYCCAVKPQSAYFEQFGSIGVSALAKVVARSKMMELPVIMDAKRGDIGTTSQAYAHAFLSDDQAFQSDLVSDALTVNPLMGEDSVKPFIDEAKKHDKGLFLLTRTSNKGASFILEEVYNNKTISHKIARQIEVWGKDNIGKHGYHHIGAVVGATATDIAKELRELMPHTIILAPGMGAQGGDLETVVSLFNNNRTGCVIPISRGITSTKNKHCSEREYRNEVKENIVYFKTLLEKGFDTYLK